MSASCTEIFASMESRHNVINAVHGKMFSFDCFVPIRWIDTDSHSIFSLLFNNNHTAYPQRWFCHFF